jgi:ABC-type multidrug transport system permease subunit
MKTTEILQKMGRNFLIIFASIIIMLTILRQVYNPQLAFDLKSIYIVMGFSLISALTGLILYSPDDLSEQKMLLRRGIHFFTLECLLIALSSILGIVESPSDGLILAVQIAIIYLLVRLLSWQKDKKEAQQINEKLMERKKKSS